MSYEPTFRTIEIKGAYEHGEGYPGEAGFICLTNDRKVFLKLLKEHFHRLEEVILYRKERGKVVDDTYYLVEELTYEMLTKTERAYASTSGGQIVYDRDFLFTADEIIAAYNFMYTI